MQPVSTANPTGVRPTDLNLPVNFVECIKSMLVWEDCLVSISAVASRRRDTEFVFLFEAVRWAKCNGHLPFKIKEIKRQG